MKHRTYYLSNGTIRVAGKLVTRCAEPYAEGDLVTLQLDMEQHHISFLKVRGRATCCCGAVRLPARAEGLC